MSKEFLESFVPQVLDASGTQWTWVVPSVAATTTDGLVVSISDTRLVAGFGVRSQITPSVELLSQIAEMNQRNVVGHLWLAPGSDNDHWSLVWGAKFPNGFSSPQDLGDALVMIIQNKAALLDLCWENSTGGQPYWTPSDESDVAAHGLVLMSHLS
jgi:hypothetical protein